MNSATATATMIECLDGVCIDDAELSAARYAYARAIATQRQAQAALDAANLALLAITPAVAALEGAPSREVAVRERATQLLAIGLNPKIVNAALLSEFGKTKSSTTESGKALKPPRNNANAKPALEVSQSVRAQVLARFARPEKKNGLRLEQLKSNEFPGMAAETLEAIVSDAVDSGQLIQDGKARGTRYIARAFAPDYMLATAPKLSQTS